MRTFFSDRSKIGLSLDVDNGTTTFSLNCITVKLSSLPTLLPTFLKCKNQLELKKRSQNTDFRAKNSNLRTFFSDRSKIGLSLDVDDGTTSFSLNCVTIKPSSLPTFLKCKNQLELKKSSQNTDFRAKNCNLRTFFSDRSKTGLSLDVDHGTTTFSLKCVTVKPSPLPTFLKCKNQLELNKSSQNTDFRAKNCNLRTFF